MNFFRSSQNKVDLMKYKYKKKSSNRATELNILEMIGFHKNVKYKNKIAH